MPKGQILTVVILFFLSVFPLLMPNHNVFAESITITTYYPAPFGVYDEMRANKMVIGDSDSTSTPSPDTDGVVRFKGISSDPIGFNDTEPGALYYNTSDDEFRYYDSTEWKALGGGTCPSGFTDTGYGYCIQTNENSARTWYNASDYCADTYNARICTSSEWYNACMNIAGLSNMIGNDEWVDSWTNDSANGYAIGRGSSVCYAVSSAQAEVVQWPFRC